MNERSGYRNGQLIYPISVLITKPQEGGGGGGGSCQPGPNTVGTEEIIDGSIIIDDMNPNTMAQSNDIDNIFDN